MSLLRRLEPVELLHHFSTAATIQSVIGSVARRHEVSEELLTTKTQREGSLNRNKLEDIPPEQKTDD